MSGTSVRPGERRSSPAEHPNSRPPERTVSGEEVNLTSSDGVDPRCVWTVWTGGNLEKEMIGDDNFESSLGSLG